MAIHKSVNVGDIIFIRHLEINSPRPTARIFIYRLRTRRGRTNGARVPMKFKKYFKSLNIKIIESYYDKDHFTAVGVEKFIAYLYPNMPNNHSIADGVLSIYKNKFTIDEMLADTMKFELPKPSDSIKQMSNKIFIQTNDIDQTSVLPQDEDGLSELDIFKHEHQTQEDNPYEFKFMV